MDIDGGAGALVGERERERESTGQGLAYPPCAEEHHDAGLAEWVHERGGHGARPNRVGVLARTQQVRLWDELPVPETSLERLDVGQPH
jgi:hypothetical protein